MDEFLPPLVAELKGDIADFAGKMDEAVARLDEFDNIRSTAEVLVDGQEAIYEVLDRIDGRLADFALERAVAEVALDGNDEVNYQLDELNRRLDEFGRKRETAHVGIDTGGGVSTLMGGLLAAGPALIPLLGVLTGGMAAFGGAAVAAGIGTAGFAAIAVPEIEKAVKGTGKLTAAEQVLHDKIESLLGPWHAFEASLQPKIIGDVTVALHTLTDLLPHIEAIIRGSANAFGVLERDASHALEGPFWTRFLSWLGREAPTAITTFGKVGGNVLHGLAGLFMAFTPLMHDVEKGLLDGSKRFADWASQLGKSQGFQDFLSYVESEAPKVGAFIESLAGAVGDLVRAFAPVGSVVLSVLTGLLHGFDRLAAAHPGLLQDAAGLAAIAGAASLVAGPLKSLGGLIESLIAQPKLAIIAGIGIAFYEAYQHSQPFRNFVQSDLLPVLHELWSWIDSKLVPVLKHILVDALHGLEAGFAVAAAAVQRFKPQLLELWHAFQDVAGFIVQHVLPVLGPVLEGAFTVLGAAIGGAVTVIAGIVSGFNGVVGAAKAVAHFFTGPFIHAVGLMGSYFIRGVKAIADAAMSAFGVVVHGAEKAFGWLPLGIGSHVKAAAKAFDGMRTSIDSTLSKTAASMAGWGEKIGSGLGQGILTGLALQSPAVIAKAHHLGWAAAKSAAYGAEVSSPSKITTWVGRMIAEGLIQGWSGEAGRVRSALSTGIQDALTHLDQQAQQWISKQQQVVKAAHSKLKQLLGQERSDITSLAPTISGFDLSSLFGTDANGNPTVGNLGGYLSGQAAITRKFVTDLEKLSAKHLAPGLVEAIANLGPVQGDQLAQQVLSGQAGSIGGLDATFKQIGSLARAGATSVVSPLYAHREAEDHANIRKQVSLLAEIRDEIRKGERAAGHTVGGHVSMTLDSHGRITHVNDSEARIILDALERVRRHTGADVRKTRHHR